MEAILNYDVILGELAEIEWELANVRETIETGENLLQAIENTVRSMLETKKIDDKLWIGQSISNIDVLMDKVFQGAYVLQKYEQESTEAATYKMNFHLRKFSRELYKIKSDLRYDISDVQNSYERYLIDGSKNGDELLLKNIIIIYKDVAQFLKKLNVKLDELREEELRLRRVNRINRLVTINDGKLPV